MKKFLIKLSYTVLPVFVILLGLITYVSLYVVPKATGDLGHLALIEMDDEYGKSFVSRGMKVMAYTTVNTTDELKAIHVNVLTVGDSFSQLGVDGYQNYMAAEGLTVANTKRNLYDNPILYAYNILDGGIVDSTNIDVMIVEVGERDFLARIDGFSVDKIAKPDLEVLTDGVDEGSNANEWSFLRARDYVIYRLGIRRPVYTATLNQDCFDSKDPRKLYFYYADLEEMSVEEPIKHKIKEVFDLMLNLANEKGIDFLLMIPVDKYDLYQDHIVDNPYPHPKTINEDVREILGDTANLILCKYYLKPMLEKGEKDVFLFDDSHWSYKSAKVVGEELGRRVKELMRLKSLE